MVKRQKMTHQRRYMDNFENNYFVDFLLADKLECDTLAFFSAARANAQNFHKQRSASTVVELSVELLKSIFNHPYSWSTTTSRCGLNSTLVLLVHFSFLKAAMTKVLIPDVVFQPGQTFSYSSLLPRMRSSINQKQFSRGRRVWRSSREARAAPTNDNSEHCTRGAWRLLSLSPSQK